MTVVIGIDCATQPTKTGLVYATWDGKYLRIEEATLGSKTQMPRDIVGAWLRNESTALLALDAPLGWPTAMGAVLAEHSAGQPIAEEMNSMFHRYTDDEIQKRFNKRPLEVGANLIARTAHAALQLLQGLREDLGVEITLAWTPGAVEGVQAIEVYPAVTHLALRATNSVDPIVTSSMSLPYSTDRHLKDAELCATAGADYMRDNVVGPTDLERAKKEGWIWVRAED